MSVAERLQEEIDRSFAGEPPLRPVEDRLAAGHRALRRRRGVAAALACGVVAVTGTAYAVSGPGSTGDAGQHIATEPSSTPGTDPTPTATSTPGWEDDNPVRYRDGVLEIRPGVVVHHHIDNPYDYRAPRQSDALDLTYEGQRMWLIADQTDNGFGYISSVPSAGWASFSAWVDDQVTAAGGDGYPATMRLTAAGRVVPVAGAEVLQRTDEPDLGPTFAPAGATVGAAVVRPPDSVFTYFVVWRVIDGRLDVIYTPPRTSDGATFEELLNAARQKYADGVGLR